MKKASPQKIFLDGPNDSGCNCAECPYMRLNTLEKLHACMEKETPEILMSQELLMQAFHPLKRMMELSAA
jgi:quinolinate synthase